MKVAIFENEFDSVMGAFETANLMYFDESLKIDWFPSSQKADIHSIHIYEVIFIDIDLSSKSELDGFALIKKFYSMDSKLIKRIVILTGNNKIEEALIQRGIEPSSVQILIKPSDYEEIAECIKKVTDSN